MNKLMRMLLVSTLIVLGIGLMARGTSPVVETAERQSAVQAFSPGVPTSNADSKPGAIPVPRSEHEIVTSHATTMIMADVPIDTTVGENAMINRYLRGEIDLTFIESGLTEAERQARMEAALNRPVDGNDVQRAPENAQTPTIGAGFAGMDHNEGGGSVPPDPDLAVGLNHIISTVNVAVEIYDKSGTSLLGPTLAENLFTNAPCTANLFDPNVLYDEEEDRWFLAYDQGADTAGGGYCVLASQTGDPLGTWNEYFFNLNDATAWLDYPHAGVGDEYIFMGGNYFQGFVAYDGARIHAFKKADLYAGNPVTAITRNLGTTYATIQPLNLHGESTGTWPAFGADHYFMTENNFGTDSFSTLRWNPKTDTLTDLNDLTWAGGDPVNTQQGGNGGTITPNDTRPLDFEYRNGYGWTTMVASCNPGGGTVNCLRWGQIDLFTGVFGPEGSGVYGADGDYMTFPDLAVNHCDSMALGYTNSNTNSFPAVYVTGRQTSDAAGSLQAQALVKAGEITYTAFDAAPRRWGDYTSMTIDPDGYTFWYGGEYSKDTGTTDGRWGVWINSFTYETSGCTVPADLDITKSVDMAGPILVGDTIEYTISVENNGAGFGNTTVLDSIPSELDNVNCVLREELCPEPGNIIEIGTVTFDCPSAEVVASGTTGGSGGRPGTLSCTGSYSGTNDPIAYVDLAGLTWTTIGGSWASELQAFIDCPAGGMSDYNGAIGGAPANTNGNAPFTAGTATNTGCAGELPTGTWTIAFNESYGDNPPNPDTTLSLPIVLTVYGQEPGTGGGFLDTPVSTTLNENTADFGAYDTLTYVCTGVVSDRVCNGASTTTLFNSASASASQDPAGTVDSNQVSTIIDLANSVQCDPLAIDMTEQVSAEQTISIAPMVIVLTALLGLGLTAVAVRKRA